MDDFDGPTLRAIRESVKVPLRRVSRMAGMSHGHLSKVERGEHGRPVTPRILAAYEKATGIRLDNTKTIGILDGTPAVDGQDWRRGRLNDTSRLAYNALIAGVAVGGPIGEPRPQLLDSLGHYVIPATIDPTDIDPPAAMAQLATSIDLRSGGGLTSQLTRTILRWALSLTKAATTPETRTSLNAAIAHLAQRAGWAAFDADRHHAARTMYTIAIDAAILAADRDLRAHILADIAAQHNHLRHHTDALDLIELAEGDPHLSPPVRAALYSVKARTYAACGDIHMSRRYLTHAEEALTHLTPDTTDWQASIATLGHVSATTGHALASIARHTSNDADHDHAIRRLTTATNNLDPHTHTRSLALCTVRLAALNLTHSPDLATAHTLQTLTLATHLRSSRLTAAINALRATALTHPTAAPLVDLIDQHRQQHSRPRRRHHDLLPAADTTEPTPHLDKPTPLPTTTGQPAAPNNAVTEMS